MSPSPVKHVHKLKRHTYKNDEQVYFCVLPDCKFKINVKLALGKRTICNRCAEEFIINERTLRLAKPHCLKCTKGYNEPANVKSSFSIRAEDIAELRDRLSRIGIKKDIAHLDEVKEDLL